MSKIVKTQKIQISHPVSTNWDTFSRIAGDISHQSIKIMNDALTMYYIHIQEKYQYKLDHGKAMNVKEVYGMSYPSYINNVLKDRYSSYDLAGDLVGSIIRLAIDTFNTNSKEILSGNASLPVFRRDQPIPVRNRTLNLSANYTAELSIMSAKQAAANGFTGVKKQRFTVQLLVKKHSKRIIDRILNDAADNTIPKEDKYELCDSFIQKDLKGKWYLILTYKQPVKKVTLDKDKITGVDLGISKAAYVALSDSKENFFINGGEISSFRRRIQGRRKSILKQLPACSENRRGRGRKTLLKPIEKLKDKESNFSDLINHRYSKKIVDWAKSKGSGTIQMEDLTGISKRSSFLSNWTYYDLQQKIKYKAKNEGIDVILIDPKFTSQRCNKCGYIDTENRVVDENKKKDKAEIFECVRCKHRTNADLNAARNIATKNIDKIIKKEMKEKNILNGDVGFS